jgi:beta-glucosidase
MASLLLGLVVIGCAPASQQPPQVDEAAKYKDPVLPAAERAADLLARLTLAEKVGQMTQLDRLALRSKADLATYFIGSVLSGGDSAPSPNLPATWVQEVEAMQNEALETRLGIPLLYGIDAVHGLNSVKGGTIFPHNIGLGATRNPELLQRIGAVTAAEMSGLGVRWTFAPCLAVARNERWGRTYESYGEDPAIGSALTTYITGLQGEKPGGPQSVLATAKHWIGDGNTEGGQDQGDAKLTEADLRALALPPYLSALQRGVGSVMVSFSSWNGQKAHGSKYLITDLLKGELQFDGFVVSDWQGVDQVAGDYATAVRTAINAGIDMVMVPNDYPRFIRTLTAEVTAGRVPVSRIDDAVRRILTQKFALGLFEQPGADPSQTDLIGSAAHLALAREAVRQSLVVLKNERSLLPLPKSGIKLYVAGKNADDLGNQLGGWSITWQGGSGNTTTGTTILQGIRQAVAPGAVVTYDRAAATIDGSYGAAIVVVGELPYAEMKGDRTGTLRLDAADLQTLQQVKAAGVPTVVVLVSGRPLVVTDLLPDWQAFVAAWLPGTEGAGVADLLFGDYRPTGKLPVTWPRSEGQIPINVGDPVYEPLFPYGFGLSW